MVKVIRQVIAENPTSKVACMTYTNAAVKEIEERVNHKVKQYLTENHVWDFTDAKKTKELNLTHNLIADKAGFRTLMDIYDRFISIKTSCLMIKNRMKMMKTRRVQKGTT